MKIVSENPASQNNSSNEIAIKSFFEALDVARKNPYGETPLDLNGQVFIDNQMLPVILALGILGVKSDYCCHGVHDLSQRQAIPLKRKIGKNFHVGIGYLCLKTGEAFPESFLYFIRGEGFSLNPNNTDSSDRQVIYAFPERLLSNHPEYGNGKTISYVDAWVKNDRLCHVLLAWSETEMERVLSRLWRSEGESDILLRAG